MEVLSGPSVNAAARGPALHAHRPQNALSPARNLGVPVCTYGGDMDLPALFRTGCRAAAHDSRAVFASPCTMALAWTKRRQGTDKGGVCGLLHNSDLAANGGGSQGPH